MGNHFSDFALGRANRNTQQKYTDRAYETWAAVITDIARSIGGPQLSAIFYLVIYVFKFI